ncbi:MAG: RdgB/HAM1 family non-canonical purine NTP pyrophosphatase [Candidatus Bathyarchaeia archaeon]
MEPILFATRNEDKFKEAEAILSERGLVVKMLKEPKLEVQSDSLKRIARLAAVSLVKHGWSPVLVEDTGLFIHALNGFPGPYSSYVLRSLGNKGVLKLMDGVADRGAVFRCAVAFCRTGEKPVAFQGEAQGRIAVEERGIRWGYDPIFEPYNGGGLTFAEMGPEKKNKLSHRRMAFDRFLDWYMSGQTGSFDLRSPLGGVR